MAAVAARGERRGGGQVEPGRVDLGREVAVPDRVQAWHRVGEQLRARWSVSVGHADPGPAARRGQPAVEGGEPVAGGTTGLGHDGDARPEPSAKPRQRRHAAVGGDPRAAAALDHRRLGVRADHRHLRQRRRIERQERAAVDGLVAQQHHPRHGRLASEGPTVGVVDRSLLRLVDGGGDAVGQPQHTASLVGHALGRHLTAAYGLGERRAETAGRARHLEVQAGSQQGTR